LDVSSTADVPLGGIPVTVIATPDWPGEPVVLVVDQRAALIGARQEGRFSGHFGSGEAFVAAARVTLDALREVR
jgi:hypothetical protein